MLVLSRRVGQSILIGDNVEVVVLRTKGKIRIGVRAPKEVKVLRKELAADSKGQEVASR